MAEKEPEMTFWSAKEVDKKNECRVHLFSRARKKRIFLFFLWGDPVQNRPQNPAPAGYLFSTRESRFEVPESGDFGEENCLGKGGVDRAKKKEKRMRKKGGKMFVSVKFLSVILGRQFYGRLEKCVLSAG